jgi:hypothetical protein
MTVGSLNILQNQIYSVNSMTIKTTYGTHCIAGKTVNTVDTDCPNASTRALGITATVVEPEVWCTSVLYVCSDAVGSCPSSGTSPSGGQGSFTITLNDGPVSFLIFGSSTSKHVTYGPDKDTFAVTSQNIIRDDADDFSNAPKESRIYIYEIVSPNYAKMWVHSSLRQYLEIRPWLISLLSLTVLKPAYYKNTLIHIPRGVCPYAKSENITTNALLSSRIEALSYFKAGHVVAMKSKDSYREYIVNSDNDYAESEIIFTGGNIFIQICLGLTGVIALVSIVIVFIAYSKFKPLLEKSLMKYLGKKISNH